MIFSRLKAVGLGVLSFAVAGSASAQTTGNSMPWYDVPWLGKPKNVSPVIASEREISVSADGMLSNYKEYFDRDSDAHDRELGWTPGLTVKGSTIFDFYRLHDIYVSVQGNFNIGNEAYHGGWHDHFGDSGALESRTNQHKAYGQGELGKAWRLTPQLLLITAFQGGHGYWNRSINAGWGEADPDLDDPINDPFFNDHPNEKPYIRGDSERYQYNWAGGAVHLDYAITPKLVAKVNGAVGGTFQPRMGSADIYNHYRLGNSVRFDVGGAVDYRLTQRWHMLASVDYQQFGFGRSHDERARYYRYYYEPNSRTQQLHLGLGVGFGF
ncbi:hypothetical protein [Swingsia samuiensis]|uniref:Outer membrane protein beta-barrel domain-containing protein n=1 Tax=Swingsia samuiensis TaxID=1293412 RepID=A0A4Y6UJ09_9PROT|nr:hypothetical protein [Swingsia samuiensis]QDH17542.1 hypothetical protein E3D00_08190 [Swingsia samuiensis]